MTIGSAPVCLYCRHYQRRGICDAFPNGIPLHIWSGANPHGSMFPGDHGIRFEVIPGKDEVFAERQALLAEIGGRQ